MNWQSSGNPGRLAAKDFLHPFEGDGKLRVWRICVRTEVENAADVAYDARLPAWHSQRGRGPRDGRPDRAERFARQQLARAELVLAGEKSLVAEAAADHEPALERSPVERSPVERQPSGTQPMDVAEYVDNVLAPVEVADFERLCLESDEAFAELVAVHQIVARVLSQPVKINEQIRSRLHALPAASTPTVPAGPSPFEAPTEAIAPECRCRPCSACGLAARSTSADRIAPRGVAALGVPSTVAADQCAAAQCAAALVRHPRISPSAPPPHVLPPARNEVLDLPVLSPVARLRRLPQELWERALSACGQQARYYVQSTLVHLLLFIVVGMVAGHLELLKPQNERPMFDTVLGASVSDSPVFDLGECTAGFDRRGRRAARSRRAHAARTTWPGRSTSPRFFKPKRPAVWAEQGPRALARR